jgi:hypothetical protein
MDCTTLPFLAALSGTRYNILILNTSKKVDVSLSRRTPILTANIAQCGGQSIGIPLLV